MFFASGAAASHSRFRFPIHYSLLPDGDSWATAGGLDFAFPGFVHTVLVDMRARLRASERPQRIFEAALAVAKEAGLIGRKRVIDSTALYDAVATQDTVTLIRSAIRGLLRSALNRRLRTCMAGQVPTRRPAGPAEARQPGCGQQTCGIEPPVHRGRRSADRRAIGNSEQGN